MKILHKLLAELSINIDYFKLKDLFDEDNYKRFTELVTFVHYCNCNPALKNSRRLELLNKFAKTEVEKLSSDIIFKNLYFSNALLMPYILIRKSNKVTRLEKCMNLVYADNLYGSELPPHREMELDYFKQKLGIVSNVQIPKSSILNSKIHLVDINRDFIYSYTHTLFYLFDFGFIDSKPQNIDLNQIRFQLECLIIKSYQNLDIDVLLELGINYFSLCKFTTINPYVLQIIEAGLIKINFIEFEWKRKNNIHEKYHSFLVLGIFSSLLQSLILNTNITNNFRKKLNKVFTKSVFNNNNEQEIKIDFNKIEKMPEFETWKILLAFKSKKIEFTKYRNHIRLNGFNKYLDEEIVYYLNIYFNRNNLDILWEREFAFLKLPFKNRLILKNTYNETAKKLLKKKIIKGNKTSPNKSIALPLLVCH